MSGAAGPSPLLARELVFFYGITAARTLQIRELFRFMENTGPQWWLPVSGMTRNEFWRSRKRTLVARRTTIRILADGCRANDKVTVEHVIRHGRRPRSAQRPPEYGFWDFVQVRRDSDEVVLADLTAESVWLELGSGIPRVATTAPDGLDCPDEELPEVEPAPPVPESEHPGRFRWTLRETDFNGHVSFPCYYERAENALADAGQPAAGRGVWQGWYRQESFAGEPMQLHMQQSADGHVFGFLGDDARQPRVTVTFRPHG